MCVKYTTGVAVLRMCKKPVNSLNLDMLTELTIALDKLESNFQCNGLILTSVSARLCYYCTSLCSIQAHSRWVSVSKWQYNYRMIS